MTHPNLLGARCDPREFAGETDKARVFARIGFATNWANERIDVIDRPDFPTVIPEHCWYDQAICGQLLVPVVAWSLGNQTFGAHPVCGEWPSNSEHTQAMEARMRELSSGWRSGGKP